MFLTTINEKQLTYLLNCETAAEMWKKLISVHEQKTEVSKHIYQKLYELQMNKNQDVTSRSSVFGQAVKRHGRRPI